MPAVRHSRVKAIVAVVAAGACTSDQSGGGSAESGSTTAESGVTETEGANGSMDGATADGTSADASSDGSTTGGAGECNASPWATGADGPFAVSLDEEGSPAFAVSRPRVSADGRYVLFTSVQTPSQELSLHWVDNACQTSEVLALEGFEPGELTAGLDDLELSADGSTVVFNVRGPENGQLRAFAYDVPSHTQERIDVLPDGTPGSGAADAVSVSGDGRYVAFVSNMTMTADDDEDGIFDAIVRDRQTGTNELVSVDDDGAKSNNHVDWTSISSDGQLVGFSAFASSLSPIDGYTTGNHAYVRNREQGVLELASPQPADLPAGATTGFNPHVSGSGRWVVFGALHGIAPDDDDERDDIYLRDRETQDVIMVSQGITEALGDVAMTDPWVSDDGQRVLYTVGKNDGTGIFVYLTDRTLQQSIEVGPGLSSLQITHLRMSADGQWLVEIVSYPEPFDPPLMPGTSVVTMRRVDTLFE